MCVLKKTLQQKYKWQLTEIWAGGKENNSKRVQIIQARDGARLNRDGRYRRRS